MNTRADATGTCPKKHEHTILHQTPFPCVVYIRKKDPCTLNANAVYEFSHYCHTFTRKPMPLTLRVRDLQQHARANETYKSTLRRACFLVLAAGDTAQCVSISNTREERTRFLFRGSAYDIPAKKTKRCSEFHEDYVPLQFYSTLAGFSPDGRLGSVLNLECGIALFPGTVRENQLHMLAKWVEHNITKSIHSSAWATHALASYNEATRSPYSKKRKLDC